MNNQRLIEEIKLELEKERKLRIEAEEREKIASTKLEAANNRLKEARRCHERLELKIAEATMALHGLQIQMKAFESQIQKKT